MKALVKSKSERGLWLQDAPEPAIGINDVLIRVDRTGICGTDLHIYKWDAWARKTIPVPMVVGHEFGAKSSPLVPTLKSFSPDRSSAAKATSFAAIAGMAWLAGGIGAGKPKARASIAPARAAIARGDAAGLRRRGIV